MTADDAREAATALLATAYRQIGNGVSVPVGEWVGREVTRYFGRGAA